MSEDKGFANGAGSLYETARVQEMMKGKPGRQ